MRDPATRSFLTIGAAVLVPFFWASLAILAGLGLWDLRAMGWGAETTTGESRAPRHS